MLQAVVLYGFNQDEHNEDYGVDADEVDEDDKDDDDGEYDDDDDDDDAEDSCMEQSSRIRAIPSLMGSMHTTS